MKKRLFALLLTAALLFTLLPQTVLFASADDSGTCGENLEWSFDEATGTLTITGTGAMKNWSYASDVPWYSYCSSIKSVSLPDGLTSIGDDAFSGCTGLTGITIPDSVTSIGDSAFYYCTGLTSVTIGNGVTSIGYAAFYYCTGLTSITIPDSVTSIGGSAFNGCTGLTAISIPDSVTSIGDYAFYYCTGLTAISIPDSVTSIGFAAFMGCTELTAISIPSGVTSIGYFAFAYCTGLTAISIPDSVTSIGEYAFAGCTGLFHIHFLGSKPSIESSAFLSCASDLTLCYLPETTGWEFCDYPAELFAVVETVHATCTEQGSADYVCSCGESYPAGETDALGHDFVDGICSRCGETRTEQTEPLGHSFVNGVCVNCGETLKIFSASLRLDENLNMVYAVQLPENIENPRMVFTFLGTEITVTDYTVNADGRYCFELADINPQCMGDTISATLYATFDGTEYTDTIEEYSVRDYCVNMLTKTNDDLFVTLLSDILTYGAAAQTYTNYKTDALVTDGLDLTPSTFPALSGLTEEFAGTADPDTFWKSASLTLRNNVDMNLFFCTDNVEGLSVVLEINGRTETVTDFTPVDGEENLYQITFHGILATEFDLPVLASFYRDGAQVGNTLSYSVNTYICSKQNDGDAALAAMVRALYNYGATANTYFFERYLVQ